MKTRTGDGDGGKERKTGKLVFLGFGAVARAIMEMLPICESVPKDLWDSASGAEPIVAIEPRDVPAECGVRHVRASLDAQNLDAVLSGVLSPGDVLIDASVNVDALAVMRVCARIGCLYANTSMEDWATKDPPTLDTSPEGMFDRSLCTRVAEAKHEFGRSGLPTMLSDQGMNPGLISQLVMQGLEDYAVHRGDDEAVALMRAGAYASAARRLKLRAVHITERDTQRLTPAAGMPGCDEFWNTWSAGGLVYEALDPCQLGFSPLESPPRSGEPARVSAPSGGPDNMRCLPVRGMDLMLWSYSPARYSDGSLFAGYAISHGETNTISARLTERDDDGTVYRPSVYFVYKPCFVARQGLERMRRNGYRMPSTLRTLSLPAIESGYDAVGAMLLFGDEQHPVGDVGAWWIGSVLDVEDVRSMGVRESSPTVVQVAASMLAALAWMTENSREGYITPEDLPYARIVRAASPFLGRMISRPVPRPVAAALPRDRQFSDFVLP